MNYQMLKAGFSDFHKLRTVALKAEPKNYKMPGFHLTGAAPQAVNPYRPNRALKLLKFLK